MKERLMTLLLVKDWGWHDKHHTHADKMRMSRAASRLIAYDSGFKRPFSYAEIMVWDSDIKLHLDEGEFAVDVYLKTRQSALYTWDLVQLLPTAVPLSSMRGSNSREK